MPGAGAGVAALGLGAGGGGPGPASRPQPRLTPPRRPPAGATRAGDELGPQSAASRAEHNGGQGERAGGAGAGRLLGDGRLSRRWGLGAGPPPRSGRSAGRPREPRPGCGPGGGLCPACSGASRAGRPRAARVRHEHAARRSALGSFAAPLAAALLVLYKQLCRFSASAPCSGYWKLMVLNSRF